MKHKIIAEKLNIPWEEKPQECNSPIWRFSRNPIINRNPIKNVERIFNSAVIPFNGEFIGVFRGDTNTTIPFLYVGHSKDGISFKFEEEPIKVYNENNELVKFDYCYDPRLIEIEGTYFVSFCTHFHGPTIAIIKTQDFKNEPFEHESLTWYHAKYVFETYENACESVITQETLEERSSIISANSSTWHTTAFALISNTARSTCCWGSIIRPFGAELSIGVTRITKSFSFMRSPKSCFSFSIPLHSFELTRTPASVYASVSHFEGFSGFSITIFIAFVIVITIDN